ncbi:MAG: helix-turn-helix transcriptional regulator, partial [Flavobacteriales bacterium]|nr:helix-turn-helix transcriptional regulator [Flavobacteriales bacterium]
EAGDEEAMLSSQINMANVWNKSDKEKEAIKVYEDAVRFYEKEEDINGIILSKNNLAAIYFANGLHQKEIREYHEILALMIETGAEGNKSAILLNMSSTFEKIGQMDSAFYYSNLAKEIALESGQNQFLESIYDYLSELHLMVGNEDSSLHYKNCIIDLRDSINTAQEELKMLEIEGEYKNKELKLKLEKKEADQNYYEILLWGLVAAGVILVLTVVLLIRSSRSRSDLLEEEISQKSKDIGQLSVEIKKKDEVISELVESEQKRFPYPDNLTPLTDREIEVLTKLSEGLKDQEIADQLFLSITTIRTHLRKAYAKIGVRNRAEAVQFFNKYDLK